MSGRQHLERAASEAPVALAQRDQAPHPPQQRVRVVLLGLHVDGLVVVLGIDHHGQVQPLGIRPRESGVAVGAPLHRRPHAVAVAEVDVVAHADLVPVVDDRRAGQREQEAVHQLDPAPVVAEQRREPPADTEVDARVRIVGVHAVHVVPLLVGDHLQRQLVVVAEKQRPLARLRDRGRLRDDVDDREAVLHADRHEQARHQRKVEGHVALVAGAEVGDRVLGPLVGLGEQHAVRVPLVDVPPEFLQKRVRLGKVLARRAVALVQVRHRVQPQPVDALVEPEVDHAQHRAPDVRRVEVEIRLVRVEPVPVVRARDRIQRPVGGLEVLEDDARVPIPVRRVAPDVEVPPAAARRRRRARAGTTGAGRRCG